MKKRFLSIILTLVMCLSLLPTAAFAADETPEVRYSTDGGETWTEDSLMDVVSNTGSAAQVQIELLRSFTLTDGENWGEGYHLASESQNVTVDGKGFTITRGNGVLKMVSVAYGSTVTLKNITIDGGAVWSDDDPLTRTNSGLSNSGGAHIFEVYDGATLILDKGAILQNNHLAGSIDGGAIRFDTNGTVIMKAGSVIRNNAASYGGAVSLPSSGSGTFEMQGGEIYGNYAVNTGGAVYNAAAFEMKGGAIYKNYAASGGGGIYTAGSFEMQGGEISENTTGNNGGGVTVAGSSSSISGGTITGNTSNAGGGVSVLMGSFTIEGGSIKDNEATGSGGGVYAQDVAGSGANISMEGGEISGNTAQFGGGAFITKSGTQFMMDGGEISGNNATNGGGVDVRSSGAFQMWKGNITGNNASAGGGVITVGGTVYLIGGSVTGNTSTNSGAGVYFHSGSLTVSGNPTVSGNTSGGAANNMCIISGNKLSVSSMTGSMGVTTSAQPADDTPVVFAGGSSDISGYVGNFFSDKGYAVQAATGDSTQLVLATSTSTDLSGAAVGVADGSVYDGNEKTPAVTVVLNGQTLTKDTDYTVSYSNHTDAGTAQVIVTGTGAYTGTKTADFTIEKGVGSGSVTLEDWIYNGTPNTPILTSDTNDTSTVTYHYKVKDAHDSTYTTTVPTDVGTYTVRVTFATTNNYNEVTATDDFTILPASQDAPPVPVLESKSTNSVTLKTIEKNSNGAMVEYSKDGGNTWQDSPIFTGLSAGTKYNFAVRYAEIDNYNASPASAITEITTDTAPYIPPYTPPTESVTIPISGEENSIEVDASVSGSKATVDEVDLSELDTVIGEEVSVGTVTIDFSGLNQDIDTVEIPSDVVKQIAEAVNDPNNDAESLEVVLSDGTSIEFDAVALGEKAAQADGLDITISIENSAKATLTAAQKNIVGSNTAYDINVTSGGKAISDMGGKITVHAPYVLKSSEIPRGVVVYYVDDNGNKEACETSYDSVKKRVNWKTDHLSLYMIGYDEALAESCDGGDNCPSAAFTDLDTSLWYHEYTDFVIENSLMQGTSTTEKVFSPNGIVSRAQIVTVLWRLEGEPVVNYAMTFNDVADGKWYTEAVRWAASEGIVLGWNNKYAPDDAVTREQLAAILWRYAQYKGYNVSVDENTNILGYTDAESISEYAVSAVRWANGIGMMEGYNGQLKPLGETKRSEFAKMITVFIESTTAE